jgi:exonuclease SbcC
LTQLKKELPPDADSLERRAARKKLELAKNQQKTLLLREEIAALRAEISLHSEEGLYSKIGELEEKREIVQSQYRWLAAQAQAIKLLHELAHARHETMLSSITDPIREGINDLVRRVTDQPNRSLELAADLSFSGIHVSNEELPQPVDVFSIGTQEQMLLLARLALAHFLSADERQLVVLDDALVNSDGPRRERILSLLAEAADQRLQLVILTCHPDMYQQLPGRRYSLSG